MRKTIIFITFLIYSINANSFEFGVGTHLSSYPNPLPDYTNELNAIGFNSIRDEISWQSVEKTPGEFSMPDNLSRTDIAFKELQKSNNISSILILSYGNDIYTKGGYPDSELDIKKFSDYVSWIVKRYKGQVRYYEIWNEWLLGTGVPDKKMKRPGDDIYLSLVKAASQVIRKEDPSAIIITGSINPLKPMDRDWLYGLVNKGLLKYVDGISVHPYSFQFKDPNLQSPEGNIRQLDYFENELTNIAKKDVPIYITEVGYPTTYFFGGFDSERAGIDTLKYSLLARSRHYIKGIWWYDLLDDGTSNYNREHHFGLLTRNMEYKPSSRYLKEFSSLIINSAIVDDSGSVDNAVRLEISGNNYKKIISWDYSSSKNNDESLLKQLRSAD